MKFKMPVINELKTRISKLDVDYVEAKNIKHTQSFFHSPRTNPQKNRLEDIYFLQSITKDVVDIKFDYHKIDDSFADKDYASETAPFLKNAISGAAFLILTDINREFPHENTVKGQHVLASRIMDIYGIDKLSDIPREKQLECFKALEQYLTVREHKPWHADKSNLTLMKELETAIANISAHMNIFASRVS